jgi:hypothetical protein
MRIEASNSTTRSNCACDNRRGRGKQVQITGCGSRTSFFPQTSEGARTTFISYMEYGGYAYIQNNFRIRVRCIIADFKEVWSFLLLIRVCCSCGDWLGFPTKFLGNYGVRDVYVFLRYYRKVVGSRSTYVTKFLRSWCLRLPVDVQLQAPKMVH